MKRKLMMGMNGFILCLGLAACNGTHKSNSAQTLPDYKPAVDDVIDTHGEVKNKSKFLTFLDHVKKGEPDQVRVVHYTTEGDPILHDLHYNGKEIYSTVDTRRDNFGDKKIYATICKTIVETELNYVLTSCKDSTHDTSILTK
ncbi:DUF4362 domain-containing protein [Gottfriedia acidiceleris]|uniref:DUF4362 domain-containing protein n=1 Tax=Gottfriedia acidiceleris TaxID=371036 RepID=UPI00101E0646|nr:DUF4362 domain-containing protein [Gottfriedia acidiceleris]